MKTTMSEFRALLNTPYTDDLHRKKAYSTFLERNIDNIESALDTAVKLEELGLLKKLDNDC